MEKIKIFLYDDCSYYESEKKLYSVNKEDIMYDILKINRFSNKFKITKNDNDNFLHYKINSDIFNINVITPKKYLNENKECIDFFENLIKKKRKKTYINLALLTSLLSIGTIELAKRDFDIDNCKSDFKLTKIEKSTDYAVEKLEEELKIHSFNYYIDEKLIYPQDDHACVLKKDSNLSLNNRVNNYCKKYITDKKDFLTSVDKKFRFLYAHDLNEIEKIDLKKELMKSKQKSINLKTFHK